MEETPIYLSRHILATNSVIKRATCKNLVGMTGNSNLEDAHSRHFSQPDFTWLQRRCLGSKLQIDKIWKQATKRGICQEGGLTPNPEEQHIWKKIRETSRPISTLRQRNDTLLQARLTAQIRLIIPPNRCRKLTWEKRPNHAQNTCQIRLKETCQIRLKMG